MHGASMISIEQVEIGDELKVVSEDGSFTAILVEATPDDGLTFEHLFTKMTTVISFQDLNEYDFYPRGETIRRLAQIAQQEKIMHQEEAVISEALDIFDPMIDQEPDETEALIYPRPLKDFAAGDEITICADEMPDVDATVICISDGIYTLRDDEQEIDLNSESFETSYMFDFYPRGETISRLSDIPISDLNTVPETEESEEIKNDSSSQDFFELYEKYQQIPVANTQLALKAYSELEQLAITDELKEALEFIANERNQKVMEAISAK